MTTDRPTAWAAAWKASSQQRNGGGEQSPPSPRSVATPIAPTDKALQAATDFEAFQTRVRAAEAKAQEEPIVGAKSIHWRPPESWGRVIQRIPFLFNGGIPAVSLTFSHHPGTVTQLTVAVHGEAQRKEHQTP